MRQTARELKLSFFPFAFQLLLFFTPLILIVVVSFKKSTVFGDVTSEWSLESFRQVFELNSVLLFFKTLNFALISTVICLAISIPVAWYMSQASKAMQRLLLVLIVFPFWTSFLIRIYAWKVILHPEGFLKKILFSLGFVSANETLLYRPEAVILVLVYIHLPFAIIPLYVAFEKFDKRLLEASRDLGASFLLSFFSVVLPSVSRALITASILVFIPAFGSYIVPDLVGGASGSMIGNTIADKVFLERNLPLASAFSTVLSLLILIPTLSLFKSEKGNA